MTALRHVRAVALVCALATASSAGCTSLVTIAPVTDPAAPPFGNLEPGDELELTLRDGRKVDVEIERMAHVDGRDQMADVRRVEGAPEQTQPERPRAVRSGSRHGRRV